ncbi:MAG: hypothetical protein ABJN98_12230 [Roseibium sp.]
MARFPHYKKNIVELGKLLTRARIDTEFRERLLANPSKEMTRIGLPEQVQHLMTFKIVDATKDNVVALPYKLNQKRLTEKDPDYLGSIAQQFCNVN